MNVGNTSYCPTHYLPLPCRKCRCGDVELAVDKLIGWAIEKRKELKRMRQAHNIRKPTDYQALAVYAGNLQAFQQFIDKLKAIRSGKE